MAKTFEVRPSASPEFDEQVTWEVCAHNDLGKGSSQTNVERLTIEEVNDLFLTLRDFLQDQGMA